jgi:hypothetical protein
MRGYPLYIRILLSQHRDLNEGAGSEQCQEGKATTGTKVASQRMLAVCRGKPCPLGTPGYPLTAVVGVTFRLPGR